MADPNTENLQDLLARAHGIINESEPMTDQERKGGGMKKIEVDYDPLTQEVRVMPRQKLTVPWAVVGVLYATMFSGIGIMGNISQLAINRGWDVAWPYVLLTGPAFFVLILYAITGAFKLGDEKEQRAREALDEGGEQ